MEQNKLVRDNIPFIIEAEGKTCRVRTLNDEEYLKALKKKLLEEAMELIHADNVEDIKAEMADVMEVLDAIQSFHGIEFPQVLAKKAFKAQTRGRFDKRIFLESVE